MADPGAASASPPPQLPVSVPASNSSGGGAGGGTAMATGAVAAHSSRDKAFEIFVKRTITAIQKEAWGRSKEV